MADRGYPNTRGVSRGCSVGQRAAARDAIVGILVATYADSSDTLTKDDGIRYATFVAVAYILSRGFAKLGTRQPYTTD